MCIWQIAYGTFTFESIQFKIEKHVYLYCLCLRSQPQSEPLNCQKNYAKMHEITLTMLHQPQRLSLPIHNEK